MFIKILSGFFMFGFTVISCRTIAQRTLTLNDALQISVDSFGKTKAKEQYAAAAASRVTQAQRDYLPNFNFSAQQDYGTVNSIVGPSYGFNGLSAGSSGPVLASQNWNAAFGSLYLANVNWDFFAFGKARQKVASARVQAQRDASDYTQEVFEQKIKVAAAYLNLLAAQQLVRSFEKNLARADTLRHIVVTRSLNGLIAGVDSAQANAQVSGARIDLANARDVEQQRVYDLNVLLGQPPEADYLLDTVFVRRLPVLMEDSASLEQHPLLQWYKSKVLSSDANIDYLKTLRYPSFSVVGLIQTRGSGFDNDYSAQQTGAYSSGYWNGIKPTRTNYLFGLGVSWNVTTPYRVSQQLKTQKFITQGLQFEYDQVAQQLRAQSLLADTRIKNALGNYHEAPIQVLSTSQAFTQKSVLYKNGLTTLVDVVQALYALEKAETDRDIANNNVWQALLMKAAATGHLALFLSQL